MSRRSGHSASTPTRMAASRMPETGRKMTSAVIGQMLMIMIEPASAGAAVGSRKRPQSPLERVAPVRTSNVRSFAVGAGDRRAHSMARRLIHQYGPLRPDSQVRYTTNTGGTGTGVPVLYWGLPEEVEKRLPWRLSLGRERRLLRRLGQRQIADCGGHVGIAYGAELLLQAGQLRCRIV